MNFRHLKKIFLGLILMVNFSHALSAQTQNQTAAANQTTVSKDFQLNITEDRITETNFTRSTAVELKDKNRGNLFVQIGVGVRADRIDVLMRGITGRVTFRGSLESIRQRIEQFRVNKQSAP